MPSDSGVKQVKASADVVSGNKVETDVNTLIQQLRQQAMQNVIKKRPENLAWAKSWLESEREQKAKVEDFLKKQSDGYFSDLGYIAESYELYYEYHDCKGNLDPSVTKEQYERLEKLVEEYEEFHRNSDECRHGMKYDRGCSCEPEHIMQHDCGDECPPDCSLFYQNIKGNRKLICDTMCGLCNKKTNFCECTNPPWLEIKARYEFVWLAREHPILSNYPALCYVKPDKILDPDPW